MAKGSQLSQLKAALSQAGLTGNSSSKKKRSKGGNDKEKDRVKRAAKLNELQHKLNPFDVKVTKLKHDVGGRNIKGISGRPAKSKQAGIEQRKRSLLKEFETKGHAGGIIDRRFGENDPTMSLEERMLERFTQERQRASRGTTFNLEDEDELTHYGQSLSNLDDFDNVGLNLDESDEEDTGQISKEAVHKAHFGGFGDTPADDEEEDGEETRKKSKAEVMAEVIAKSKEHKLRRQLEKEQDENIRHQLDDEFDSIRQLLFAQPPTEIDKSLGAPAGASAAPQGSQTIDADYDQRVRELAFDQRAKPKDRTKTEEEIAVEQKEQLEKAEKRRRKRMLGLDDSDDEEDGRGRKRQRGGDDLDDDFHEEEEEEGWAGLGTGLDGGEVHPDASSSDEDEDEDGEEDDEGDDVVDEDDSEEDEEDLGDPDELVASNHKPGKSKGKKKPPKGELPFTFPCPSSHDEFLEIVDGLEDTQVPTVIQRIRVLHHTSLAPENKHKLQVLNNILIDYVLYVTSPPSPRFALLTSMLPHLLSLSRAYPTQSAEHFVSKLRLMHQNFKRGLSKGALDPESKTWPGVPELSLLRIIGAVWPTSDMNHIVVSPARILMGAYLGLGRVRSTSDLASGLFLSTLFLQYEQISKRLVPEAVGFSVAAVLHLAPNKYPHASSVPGTFALPDFRSDSCRHLAIDKKSSKNAVSRKSNILALLGCTDSAEEEQVKVDLLNTALELLGRFADLYKGLDGFIELYEPIVAILSGLEEKRLPGFIKTSLVSLRDRINKMLGFARQSRRPLLLQAHKPIPIATYVPKFDSSSSSSYLRNQDPDRERNEAAKLRNQYKQERKGAIRELRKDARFLATVEQEKQMEKDRAYDKRMKRVFGSIEGERAEQKAMEREKAKEKRRSGRK
ncbi:hypothetical protein ONZ45_g19016 [Pleurotus djamor]|nr:hypothetical protein ONZ45_g19016 [Pleurotus djamor]